MANKITYTWNEDSTVLIARNAEWSLHVDLTSLSRDTLLVLASRGLAECIEHDGIELVGRAIGTLRRK